MRGGQQARGIEAGRLEGGGRAGKKHLLLLLVRLRCCQLRPVPQLVQLSQQVSLLLAQASSHRELRLLLLLLQRLLRLLQKAERRLQHLQQLLLLRLVLVLVLLLL